MTAGESVAVVGPPVAAVSAAAQALAAEMVLVRMMGEVAEYAASVALEATAVHEVTAAHAETVALEVVAVHEKDVASPRPVARLVAAGTFPAHLVAAETGPH